MLALVMETLGCWVFCGDWGCRLNSLGSNVRMLCTPSTCFGAKCGTPRVEFGPGRAENGPAWFESGLSSSERLLESCVWRGRVWECIMHGGRAGRGS